ncbi:hypothetical protein BU25DRAFT_484227 [Macroventuria anomochaeta]|uniref:Uncharacterized protein n=1 Tax=Macroventuria anomochaeta TaxID=301207 RepID=A0ACB6S7L5_9PLEO|nr:uncharacterized protein BU25DRAFT_484227 [Macroventuria anomochaeta]KAF2630260.1 hypothetical protein BU25DRAFT_484227 [Macroventuria anomochaeta]
MPFRVSVADIVLIAETAFLVHLSMLFLFRATLSLQLRLTSLTCMLSHPVIDNRAVEKEERFQQTSQDLEDIDIHPETISLNKPYVDDWLYKVIENGGFAEGSSDPLSKLRKTLTKRTSTSDVDYVPMNENTSTDTQHTSVIDQDTIKSDHKADTHNESPPETGYNSTTNAHGAIKN